MSSHSLNEAPEARKVRADDGIEIAYDYRDASGGSDDTILIVPGFWRTRRWPSLEEFSRRLQREGFRVAVVDLRGHGESGGTYTFNREEFRDVEAVARDLLARGNASALHLIGFSIGGAIATCVAAGSDLPIRSLTLISAVADFGWIRPRLAPWKFSKHLAARQALRMPHFEWSFLWSRKLRAREAIEGLSVPLLIVHAKNDWLIHHRHAEALFEGARCEREIELLELEDGYHADRIFSAAPGRVESRVLEFLANQKSRS
jgi:alpha-beta hydrolase superfamily lysophospholipase